jgi:hypothetical protein
LIGLLLELQAHRSQLSNTANAVPLGVVHGLQQGVLYFQNFTRPNEFNSKHGLPSVTLHNTHKLPTALCADFIPKFSNDPKCDIHCAQFDSKRSPSIFVGTSCTKFDPNQTKNSQNKAKLNLRP